MSTSIHPQARTTPKIRQEIKDSGLSDREAAKVFNISRATAAKWLKRDHVQDRSHRAHTLHTTLFTAQEAIESPRLSWRPVCVNQAGMDCLLCLAQLAHSSLKRIEAFFFDGSRS